MKRPFYVRLTSWALFSVPIGLLALLGLLVAVGGESPPGVTNLLVRYSIGCIVVGALVRLTDRFLYPALAVTLLFALFSFVLQAETGLFHPDSFFDFATAVLTAGAPLLAFVAMIAAIRQRRRGEPRGPTPRVRRALQIGVAAVVALLAASAGMTFARPTSARAPLGTTLVRMVDSEFVPDSYAVDRGERVRFFVRNEDSFAHTFTIDDVGIDLYIGPKARKLVVVPFNVPAKDGRPVQSLGLTCWVVGHEDMDAIIRVSDR